MQEPNAKSGISNPRFLVEIPYESEMQRLLAEAKGPHYAFVQFLTAVCGGMLGLSAPLQSAAEDRALALQSIGSLVCLTCSVIAGVLALYGDKNAYVSRWKLMGRLYTKHGKNEILAKQELDTHGPMIRPPSCHRWAFHMQWLTALTGVLLLLSSKAAPLWMHPARIPSSQPSAGVQELKPAAATPASNPPHALPDPEKAAD